MRRTKQELLEFAKQLKTYYDLTRQVGHTTAMLKGADNTDCIVVSHEYVMGKHIQDMSSKKKNLDVISQNMLCELRGCRKPLLIDNAVMWLLLDDIISCLEEQK